MGWFEAGGKTHGFELIGGRYTVLDFPIPDASTQAEAINGRGQVLGEYTEPPYLHPCMFVYSAGVYSIDFGFDACASPKPLFHGAGINNADDIVGYVDCDLSQPDCFGSAGFLGTTAGLITSSFTAPSHKYCYVYGINNKPVRQLVGDCAASSLIPDGALFSGPNPNGVVFDVPGATDGWGTTARGINDAGEIAGYYGPPTNNSLGGSHGFVGHHGSYHTLDFPGATATVALGIDNAGPTAGSSYEVVGDYQPADKSIHGFVATVTPVISPTPTPKHASLARRRGIR